MVLSFCLCVFDKVAKVLNMLVFPIWGAFGGGGLFLFIWVWKVRCFCVSCFCFLFV